MRPPFLFLLGAREKETRRARCKEKENFWCRLGYNRTFIPRRPARSSCHAGLVQDGHRVATSTAAACAEQERTARQGSIVPWSGSGKSRAVCPTCTRLGYVLYAAMFGNDSAVSADLIQSLFFVLHRPRRFSFSCEKKRRGVENRSFLLCKTIFTKIPLTPAPHP